MRVKICYFPYETVRKVGKITWIIFGYTKLNNLARYQKGTHKGLFLKYKYCFFDLKLSNCIGKSNNVPTSWSDHAIYYLAVHQISFSKDQPSKLCQLLDSKSIPMTEIIERAFTQPFTFLLTFKITSAWYFSFFYYCSMGFLKDAAALEWIHTNYIFKGHKKGLTITPIQLYNIWVSKKFSCEGQGYINFETQNL